MSGVERLQVLPGTGDARDKAPGPTLEEAVQHPMRQVTRQVAFEPGGWTPDRAAAVSGFFDGIAAEWNQRITPGRLDAVADALDRGFVSGTRCVELGSGTGFATELLAERFGVVMASDLSIEMLRRAPAHVATRVWADSSRLPVRTASVDVVMLINMFLFRAEVERVLRPDGCVVWISSIGERTPIQLSPAELLAALGPAWHAVTSTRGEAVWTVARRDPSTDPPRPQ